MCRAGSAGRPVRDVLIERASDWSNYIDRQAHAIAESATNIRA
jgi:hypothetical protein